MSEQKDIGSFNPAPYNPRVMNDHDGNSLKNSIRKFGDISGVTGNTQTGYLVTGHQRIEILKRTFGENTIKIKITERLPQADEFGTTATGFIVVNGTNIKLAYREVSWTPDVEKSANIAANRIQGSFDLDLLAEVNLEISKSEQAAELLGMTGQLEEEINKTLAMAGVGEPKHDDPPEHQEKDLACPNCQYHGPQSGFKQAGQISREAQP